MRVPFSTVLSYADNFFTTLVPVELNQVRVGAGVSFDDIGFANRDSTITPVELIDKDLDVDVVDGFYVIKGIYKK